MTPEIRETMKAAEGRYLSPEEARTVLDACRDVERRLGVMRAVEQREAIIVRQTVEKVLSQFPKFYQERPGAQDKCERDVALTLRYCTLAMLHHDPDLLREKLLYWMRSILRSLEFNEITRFTYETLGETLKKHLTPAEAEEMRKYVALCAEELG
jgi:hypothetical protein